MPTQITELSSRTYFLKEPIPIKVTGSRRIGYIVSAPDISSIAVGKAKTLKTAKKRLAYNLVVTYIVSDHLSKQSDSKVEKTIPSINRYIGPILH